MMNVRDDCAAWQACEVERSWSGFVLMMSSSLHPAVPPQGIVQWVTKMALVVPWRSINK